MLENVSQDVHRGGDVAFERLGEVRGVLARGEGVEVRAHVLDLLLQVPLAAPLGALEHHVLQEVRGAIRGGRLEAAPGVDPHAHGGRLGREVALAGDAHPVRERGDPRLRRAQDGGVVRGGRQRR